MYEKNKKRTKNVYSKCDIFRSSFKKRHIFDFSLAPEIFLKRVWYSHDPNLIQACQYMRCTSTTCSELRVSIKTVAVLVFSKIAHLGQIFVFCTHLENFCWYMISVPNTVHRSGNFYITPAIKQQPGAPHPW